MADSGLLVNDEMANRADIFEQVLMSTAVDFSQDSSSNPEAAGESGALLEEQQIAGSSSAPSPPVALFSTSPSQQSTEDKGIQTELMPVAPDLQALLLQLLKLNGCSQGDASLSPSSLLGFPNLHTPTSACQPNSTPPQPILAPKCSETTDSECWPAVTKSPRFMKELDFEVSEEGSSSHELDVVSKRYWSNSFLVDLIAVAAPVLPTMAWLYSRHGVDGSAPVYNIAALIRGCCIVGLHSLRHAASSSDA